MTVPVMPTVSSPSTTIVSAIVRRLEMETAGARAAGASDERRSSHATPAPRHWPPLPTVWYRADPASWSLLPELQLANVGCQWPSLQPPAFVPVRLVVGSGTSEEGDTVAL